MNTESLRTFIILTETLNYRKAAQQLFLAQSTVSARIQDLENELGEKLFVYSGRSLQLTEAGTALQDYAQKMIKLEADIHKNICEKRKNDQTLRLGISISILDWKIRDLIPAYMEKNPDVAVEIHCRNSGLMMNDLQNDNLDLCISFLANREKAYHTQLLASETLLLVTGRKPLFPEKGMSRDALLRQPLFMTDYFNVTQELESWYDAMFPKNYAFKLRTPSIYEMLFYLKKIDGFAFLPEGFVKNDLETQSLYSVPMLFSAPPKINMYVVVKQSKKKLHNVSSFLDALSSVQQEES